MSKFIVIIMVWSSLFSAEVFLYKYNKDGTPYSKTEESTGKVYMYTNLYKEAETIEVTAKMLDEIKQSNSNENLYSAAVAFCSKWNNIAQKEATCKEFAYKVVGKELSPDKKHTIDIYRIKTADFRWISQNRYLELQ